MEVEVMPEPAPEIKTSIRPKKVKQDKSLIKMLAEAKKTPSTQSTNISNIKTDETNTSDAITIDAFKDVDNSDALGKTLIEKINNGKKLEFVNVNVKFADGDIIPAKATKLTNGKYYLRSRLTEIGNQIRKKLLAGKVESEKSEF